MTKVFTPFLRIEERALRIGLRVKRTSECEIGVPQFHGSPEPLLRRERVPLGPLVPDQIFGANPGHHLSLVNIRGRPAWYCPRPRRRYRHAASVLSPRVILKHKRGQ